MLEKQTKYLSFHQYNSPFEDLHLLVKDKRTSENMLFDIGDISKIPNKEILKLKHIFISHFHMDHFIGLSYLLRIFLTAPSHTVLYIYGPKMLIEKVSFTIGSFCWNLLDDNSFKIVLIEIDHDTLKQTKPTVFHKIKKDTPYQIIPITDNCIYKNEHFQVKFILLEHKTPVLGYKILQNSEIHFLKTECPYLPGIWVKEAKQKIFLEDLNSSVLIESNTVLLKDLKPYFKIDPTESFVYLTDFLYQANAADIIKFAYQARLLFIENHFLAQDHHLALSTYHLSTLDVKDILAKTQPQEFILCHFSRRYMGEFQYKDFLNLLIL